MSDDPRKRRRNPQFVSAQPFEIEYMVKKLSKQIPKRTVEQVREAVLKAKEDIAPSEDRQKLMDCAALKLR